MILQIIDILRALDYVQGSSLTPDEKRTVAVELRAALPAKALCSSAQLTHDIVDARIRAIFDKPVRTDGTPAGKRTEEEAPRSEENRKEEHQQPGLRQGTNGFPRDDRKAHGGPKKVSRG